MIILVYFINIKNLLEPKVTFQEFLEKLTSTVILLIPGLNPIKNKVCLKKIGVTFLRIQFKKVQKIRFH